MNTVRFGSSRVGIVTSSMPTVWNFWALVRRLKALVIFGAWFSGLRWSEQQSFPGAVPLAWAAESHEWCDVYREASRGFGFRVQSLLHLQLRFQVWGVVVVKAEASRKFQHAPNPRSQGHFRFQEAQRLGGPCSSTSDGGGDGGALPAGMNKRDSAAEVPGILGP